MRTRTTNIMRLAKQHISTIVLLGLSAGTVQGAMLHFVGDLRTDATFTTCGALCTLGPGNTDADYAQWAAVERDFTVPSTSTVNIVTFSYGGGGNGNAQVEAQGGFEPYLGLFDASGNFLASTLFGITCPPGANTNSSLGFCYDVLLDAGVLAAGNYAVTISAFENMSLAENPGSGTLGDGFAGLGNLAFGEDMHYAFDVILQD